MVDRYRYPASVRGLETRGVVMGRPVIYGRRIRVYVSPEHLAAINRESRLTGVTPSEVMRAALAAYFTKDDENEEAS